MDVLNFIGGTLPVWAGFALAYRMMKGENDGNRRSNR